MQNKIAVIQQQNEKKIIQVQLVKDLEFVRQQHQIKLQQ